MTPVHSSVFGEKMMKVLVLTTTFPRWKGDQTPAFIYELCRHLARQSLEILVLAPHHHGARFQETREGIRIFRFPYFLPLKWQSLCYDGGIRSNIRRHLIARIQIPLLCLAQLTATLFLLMKERIDAIHSHWIVPSGLIGAIASRILNIKHLATAHAADIFLLEKTSMGKAWASFVYANSDTITATSTHLKTHLLEMVRQTDQIPDKVTVQQMGTDLARSDDMPRRAQAESSGRGPTLLFVGRLVEKKGIEFLLEAMRIIHGELPEAELRIVGAGPLKDVLRARTKELWLSSAVEFQGWIGKEELVRLYSTAHVVIVPSIVTSDGDTEGMPTVISESLGMGIPVIASDVGGIADVVKDGWNGFLVPEKSPRDLAEKALMILQDDALRNEFSANARTSGRRLQWDFVARRYAELLKV